MSPEYLRWFDGTANSVGPLRLHDGISQWIPTDDEREAMARGMQNALAPKSAVPLDPDAPETFAAWLEANDGRTLEEFSVASPLPE